MGDKPFLNIVIFLINLEIRGDSICVQLIDLEAAFLFLLFYLFFFSIEQKSSIHSLLHAY